MAAPALMGPAVVSTGVMRWGASASQVAVPGPVSPTHDVVGVVPYRASTSSGARLHRPDGGRPSLAGRPCTGPDASAHGWIHTRRHVSTAGPWRTQAGAWAVAIVDNQASPSAPITCAEA